MLNLIGHLEAECTANLVTVFEEQALIGRWAQLERRHRAAADGLRGEVRHPAHEAAPILLLLLPLFVQIVEVVAFAGTTLVLASAADPRDETPLNDEEVG